MRAQGVNPYYDNKLFHWGLMLGTNLRHFGIAETGYVAPGCTDTVHARVNMLVPGLTIGFITDMRISRHLNLRFTPGLDFTWTSIKYQNLPEGMLNTNLEGSFGSELSLWSLPLNLPLYLKWSAEREGNYRPYLIGGAGVSFDWVGKDTYAIMQKPFDWFLEFGAGVDVYFDWFKFCPQITYRIGMTDIHQPIEEMSLREDQQCYTRALQYLKSRQLTITFNFE